MISKRLIELNIEISALPAREGTLKAKKLAVYNMLVGRVLDIDQALKSASGNSLGEDDKRELEDYRRILSDICNWVELQKQGKAGQAFDDAHARYHFYKEKRDDTFKQTMMALKNWIDSESKIQFGARLK